MGVKVGEGVRFEKNLRSSNLGSTAVSFKVPSTVCCTSDKNQNYFLFFSSLFIFIDTFPLPAGV